MRWATILGAALASTLLTPSAKAQESFHDDFEIDRDWFLFEEIVGGNTCYGQGIGSASPSNAQASSQTHSMLLWANKNRTLLSNHLIAVHRLAYAWRRGKSSYTVRAFIDPQTAVYQAGPEFSMQNTRLAPSGMFLSYIAAVQYQASPYLTDQGWWRVWAEVGAGKADWIQLGYQPVAPGNWYTLSIDADYDANRYLRFSIQGNGVNKIFDLTGIVIAGQNAFREETFDITLEGENLWNNCGQAGIWESRTYYDDVDVSPSAIPETRPASPASGSGIRNTFTFPFQFSGANHPIDIANVLINSSLDGRSACYLAYSRPLNVLYLVDDAGGGLLPGLFLNGTGSVSNSSCTVNGSGSSAVVNGNGLNLVLDIRFRQPSSTVTRIIYTAVRDTAGGNSGWRVNGTWTIPGASPALPTAFLQSAASGAGVTNTFTLAYRDATSGASFANAQVLINRDLNGRAACWVGYDPARRLLYLVTDDADGVLPPVQIGTAAAQENSQCRINAALSSAVVSGPDLILNLSVTFKVPFSMWLVYGSGTGPNSYIPWLPIGAWNVP